MKMKKVKPVKAEKKDIFYVRGVYVKYIELFDKLMKEKGFRTRGALLNEIMAQVEEAESK